MTGPAAVQTFDPATLRDMNARALGALDFDTIRRLLPTVAQARAWLAWRYEAPGPAGAKPRKVPFMPTGPRAGFKRSATATPEDFDGMGTLDDALALAHRIGGAGVGLVVGVPGQSDGLAALDFDNVRDPASGTVHPDVAAAVGMVYAEVSPSGRGVRALVRRVAEWPTDNPKPPKDSDGTGFEFFGGPGGFVTMTGAALPGADCLDSILGDGLQPPTPKTLALVARRLGERRAREPRTGGGNVEALEATPERIEVLRDLLAALPATDVDNRGAWIVTGAASYHAFGGDDAALAVWGEWSRASNEKYVEGECERLWSGFARESGPKAGLHALVERLGPDAPATADAPPTLRERVLWAMEADHFNVIGEGLRAERARIGASGADDPARAGGWPWVEVCIADVLTNPPPPLAQWWGPYLPGGEVTLLSAHGGTGKSYMALLLAVHVALGRDMLGLPTRPGRVLYYSAEDNADTLRRRMAYLCAGLAVDPSELADRLLVLDAASGDPVLFEEGSGRADRGRVSSAFGALRKRLAQWPADVVIVDNASDVFDADEIARRQVRAFMRALRQGLIGRDGAVLLLTHVGKAAVTSRDPVAEDYSGSTAWHNSARSRISMRRNDDGGFTLAHTKGNHSAGLAPPLRVRWPAGGLPTAVAQSVAQAADEQAQRDRLVVLVRWIGEAFAQGDFISPAATAKTHPAAILGARLGAGCPTWLADDKDKGRVLAATAEAAGWLVREDYRADRKDRTRWRVTPAGEAAVAAADQCPAPAGKAAL